MDQQKAFGRITRRVAIDRSILTYRLAARELGCTVTEAKATLQAYFESDVAKERNVGAVWLVSGSLAPRGTAADEDGEDKMDVDSSAEAGASAPGQGTQGTDAGEGAAEDEVVQRVVQRLVQDKDLEAQLPLFSSLPRPPTTHLYALLPSPSLPSLALLGPAALSLVAPSARDKWRAPPAASSSTDVDANGAEDKGVYGELVNPDGERRRVKGAAGRSGAGAGSSGAKGKGKEPVGAASSSSSRTTSVAGKKDADDVDDDKPGKVKVKAKDKKAKKDADRAAKEKEKDKDKGPKARPIGQLGGLFSRKFDEPPPHKGKKGKGKGKAAASDSDDDTSGVSSNDDDDDKPAPVKKVVPAKRKSTSPVVTRKKAASPVKPTSAASSGKKKAPDVVLDGDDGDEFDDWAMDEEAMLEAERAAEQQAAQRKTSAGASAGGSASGAKGPGKGKETKAERQKRELEEMMQSDDTMDIDSKPARSTLSRTPSTSSAAPASKPKPKNSSTSSSSAAGSGAAQQKGLGAFFKKK